MTTAVQVQYRRGTASQIAAFTGAQGELAVDITNNRVVVQDGATAGGFPAAKLSEVLTNPVPSSTVASLPASPVFGQIAAVTDGTSGLTWGATVTGGHSTKYLVWYNGTNWTVFGM
jgi:hypothetical protein